MGRPKKEMKRIHAKNKRRAKDQIRKYRNKEIGSNELNVLAKKFIKRSS